MSVNWATEPKQCKGCGNEFLDYFGSRGFCDTCIIEVEEEERERRHEEIEEDYR
jgi:hypothetical protein